MNPFATPGIDARLGGGRADRLRQAFRRRSGEHWASTDALRRGLLLGVGLFGVGVLTHRLDALLVGLPLLATTLVALANRPVGLPQVRPLPVARVADGAADRTLAVDLECGPGAELVALRLPEPGRAGPGRVHVLPAGNYRLTCPPSTGDWGEGVVLRTDHLLAGSDGLAVYGPVVGTSATQLVLPVVDPVPASSLPPRAAGLVGAHRSRRAGDSTDLRDIRPFAAGDRLRRVDWRVSLRSGFPHSGSLHVRERHADADAEVLLALDTRADVGSLVGLWSEIGLPATGSGGQAAQRSSLNASIRVACSLAASYLRQGDRVALADLGRPQLYVKSGSGSRHLRRLRHRLVLCGRSAGWAPRPILPPWLAPAGAMVVVISPFLDDAVAQMAVLTARRGHLVVAVDMFPVPLLPDDETPWGPAVVAILRAEHRVRMDTLATHGVPVLTWSSSAAAGAALRRLASGHRRRLARSR